MKTRKKTAFLTEELTVFCWIPLQRNFFLLILKVSPAQSQKISFTTKIPTQQNSRIFRCRCIFIFCRTRKNLCKLKTAVFSMFQKLKRHKFLARNLLNEFSFQNQIQKSKKMYALRRILFLQPKNFGRRWRNLFSAYKTTIFPFQMKYKILKPATAVDTKLFADELLM